MLSLQSWFVGYFSLLTVNFYILFIKWTIIECKWNSIHFSLLVIYVVVFLHSFYYVVWKKTNIFASFVVTECNEVSASVIRMWGILPQIVMFCCHLGTCRLAGTSYLFFCLCIFVIVSPNGWILLLLIKFERRK